jgi:membrane associated rhomboid family serine protease
MEHLRARPHPTRSPASAEPQAPGFFAKLKQVAWLMIGVLAVLWTVEILDAVVFDGALDNLGIRPRSVFGLVGVVASPLLHGGFGHLVSNTVGFLLFGTLVAMWSRREFALVSLASLLVGGLGVWLIGESNSIHIGASGLVFGYFGYVLTRGWYERKFLSMSISILIALTFGSVLTGAIPGLAGFGISWEGHLFGLIGGVLVARRLKADPTRSLADIRR